MGNNLVNFRAKGGAPNFAAFSFLCCNLDTLHRRGTETGDQRGGECEPIKISLEINLSAYIPKITTSPRT